MTFAQIKAFLFPPLGAAAPASSAPTTPAPAVVPAPPIMIDQVIVPGTPGAPLPSSTAHPGDLVSPWPEWLHLTDLPTRPGTI